MAGGFPCPRSRGRSARLPVNRGKNSPAEICDWIDEHCRIPDSPRGRFGNIHAARRNDASRIAIRGAALLAFWHSGKHATTDRLAECGLNVRMEPWLLVYGSPEALGGRAVVAIWRSLDVTSKLPTHEGPAGLIGRAS